RDHADGVGKGLFAGNQRRKRALGERAVADFAASGSAQERDLADRERRGVVVEHETLPLLALQALDLLRLLGGAERAGDQRLRLTASEHGRTVRAWEHAGLDPDRADLVELAAVEAHAVREDLFAQHFLLEILEDLLGLELPLDFALGDRRDQ